MKNDYPHFRRLWYRVLTVLTGAALIPLVLIGGIFSFHGVSIFKTRSVEMLVRDAALRRQHLDRFLNDRMREPGGTSRMPAPRPTQPDRLEAYLRAGLDGTQLRLAVHGASPAAPAADVFLVDARGRFQVPPRSGGRTMEPSGLGAQDRFEGVRTRTQDGRILMTTWLSAAPWVLAVGYDADEVYGSATDMVILSLWTLVIGGFIIFGCVFFTADTLIGRLEAKRRRIVQLNRQLRRSSFMTSAMELGIGLLREIGDRLSGIAVAAQWMETDPAAGMTPRGHADIRQIGESATAGRKRLNQFLTLFDPQTSMITAVNVETVARTLATWLEQELSLRWIRMAWEVEKDLPHIRTDAAKLQHAIQNVLLNAVHAVHRQGEIRIDLKRQGRGVLLTVADDGPGIPEADREKIFDPLYTTKPDGTGLGLPVARDIVQALGGWLVLLRTSSAGTAFGIFLPGDLTDSPPTVPAGEATAGT